MTRYSSHGKLLLTGEYAVLDGALALALPTRYGQSMEVKPCNEAGLFWKSLNPDGSIWFEGQFQRDDAFALHYVGNPEHEEIGQHLADILSKAQELQAKPQTEPFCHTITTRIEFSREWGLGSSSTLIYIIAQWLQIDPYALLFKTLGGSGYDVACAMADGPILYRLKDRIPMVTRVDFNPPFADELCFVYMGKKQKSSEAITHYRKVVQENPVYIATISKLTKDILVCTHLEAFEHLLVAHEEILGEVLQLPRVQQQFPGCPGTLKSLGAWGGDFILATRADASEAYFKKKGLTPVIPFSEMIL